MDNTRNGNGRFAAQREASKRSDPERAEMIALLRKRGIDDPALLRAMESLDRREFVQPAFLAKAYDDSALPIGNQQTISQPYTVAFMTQALSLQPGEKVLEIGTGSGYQAAILALMGARVFTIERHQDLLLTARKRFDRMGFNIASKAGDGTIGWKEFAPFDGIIVTAGAPEAPPSLLDQLAVGGRLVIPIGSLDTQQIHLIVRRPHGFETAIADGFKFVPLIGKEGWK